MQLGVRAYSEPVSADSPKISESFNAQTSSGPQSDTVRPSRASARFTRYTTVFWCTCSARAARTLLQLPGEEHQEGLAEAGNGRVGRRQGFQLAGHEPAGTALIGGEQGEQLDVGVARHAVAQGVHRE